MRTSSGYRSEDIDAGIEDALGFLADAPAEVDALLGHALTLGAAQPQGDGLLDAANTGSFGSPVRRRCA